jgi:FAD-linked sulfhydryl oxidase
MARQLHTVAAYYPDAPSPAEKRAALDFLRAFPVLYPCKDCAHDMERAMRDAPPRVGSREDFSIWMCQLHNQVNEKVGNPTFKCELKALDEAWRHASNACLEAQARAGARGAAGAASK